MLLIYKQTNLPYDNVECTYLQHVSIIPWVDTIVMRDPCYFPSSWFGSNNNIKKKTTDVKLFPWNTPPKWACYTLNLY